MDHPRRALSLSSLVGFGLILAACSPPSSPTPPDPTPEPPKVTCPAGISQVSPTDGPVAVTYQTPAAIGGTAPVTVTCSPASGSLFPVGSTVVVCTARDAAARTGTCGFTVQVTLAPKLQFTQYLAFGDSMTVGVVALRAPTFQLVSASQAGTYPAQLQLLLSSRYAAQTVNVANGGVQGEKATDGLVRLRGVLRDLHPQVVLLLEGANDVNEGSNAAQAAVAALERMILESRTAGAMPFLAALPPQREGGPRAYHWDLVVPFNTQLASVAGFTGAPFVDLHAAFGGMATAELIGPDGLHPTEAGYQKIADTFFSAIKAKLEIASPASRAVARR